MTPAARQALACIRRCVEDDRFSLTTHFLERMEQRGLFWPDVQAVIEAACDVWSSDVDEYDRPKWRIQGQAATDDHVEIICAIETDDAGVQFITFYWKD